MIFFFFERRSGLDSKTDRGAAIYLKFNPNDVVVMLTTCIPQKGGQKAWRKVSNTSLPRLSYNLNHSGATPPNTVDLGELVMLISQQRPFASTIVDDLLLRICSLIGQWQDRRLSHE